MPAAKPDCERICMQHWVALINVAAPAEGGGEGQIYILARGQFFFFFLLGSQKGTLSGRVEDKAIQAARAESAQEESLTQSS